LNIGGPLLQTWLGRPNQNLKRAKGKLLGAIQWTLLLNRTNSMAAATERKRVEDAIEKPKDDRAVLHAARAAPGQARQPAGVLVARRRVQRCNVAFGESGARAAN
jgi:hypothetical protein